MKTSKPILLFTLMIILLIGFNRCSNSRSGIIEPTRSSFIDHSARTLPEISEITMASPNVIMLKVEAVWIEHGEQVPYLRQEGDEIIPQFQHRFIRRNGVSIGCLVGKGDNIMLTVDRAYGDTLNTNLADLSDTYSVGLSNNATGIKPIAVYRKSKPVNCTRPPAPFTTGMEHYIMLELEKPLEEGQTYTINVKEGILSGDEISFTYDPSNQFSEAVHINQVGFRPDDPVKLAFLSFWMGNGGNLVYPEGTPFHLLDQVSGQVVFSGRSKLAKKADDPTNLSFSDIHELDFSSFNKPGTYTVMVEGIGNSFPFPVKEEVWKKAFIKSMRGLYFQRSGIALGPPHTDFIRPRGFHPADGVKVYTSEPRREDEDPSFRILPPELQTLVDSYTGKGRFASWVADLSNKEHPNAWGGYMDAGDWDRRADHALMPLMMFDLEEMFPTSFADLRFNVANENQNIPDLVNEALWGVDFLRRMQQEDGSVYAAIESGEHPRRGENSWQESLPVFAYSRTAGSAYNYVSVGSRAAQWFTKNNKPEVAKGYTESVLRAWNWAEQQREPQQAETERGRGGADARCLAAAELYRLTGEEKYHEIFLSTTRFNDASSPFYTSSMGPNGDAQGQAGWTYLRTDHSSKNMEVHTHIKNAMIRDADRISENCQNNDFKWARSPQLPIRWGALSMPESHAVCRAHYITGDEKYLHAIIHSVLTGAGANPLNLSYVTGVGNRWPQHPLHEDSRNTRQPLYEGITLGGPMEPRSDYKTPTSPRFEMRLYPDVKEWPSTEAFYDVFNIAPMNEYTVHQTMLPTSFVWGYLAARK
jgi:endoglucanase